MLRETWGKGMLTHDGEMQISTAIMENKMAAPSNMKTSTTTQSYNPPLSLHLEGMESRMLEMHAPFGLSEHYP